MDDILVNDSENFQALKMISTKMDFTASKISAFYFFQPNVDSARTDFQGQN